MCYLWSETWGSQDYLGSDICNMSLSIVSVVVIFIASSFFSELDS